MQAMNEENKPILPEESDKNLPISDPKVAPASWKSIFKEVVIFGLIAGGVVLPFRIFIAEPYIVDGASMDPTFKTADYLIVDKISYKFEEPKRNTVVVFKYPVDPSKNFIKRIIGLPGDTVDINKDRVKITNKENPEGITLDQTYLVHKADTVMKKTLGENEFFVMGDNRAESFDSRSWGILPRKNILGKPVLRLYPFNKIDVLPGDDAK
jgi:signal peptidase I